MRAGRMRHTAKLQTNTPTRDASGGEVANWADTVASWPCELEQVSGGESFRNRVVHARANHVAIGRYVGGVNTRMRMVLGSRTFDILAVSDVEHRGRTLRLELLERGV